MLSRIPAWVYAVFVVLLALGIWQSRPRASAPVASAIVAVAMLALSISGVLGTFGAAFGALLAWGVGIAASVALGAKIFGPHGLARVPGSSRVSIPGSWLPLALMMGIFGAKFAVGFATGMRVPMVSEPWFAQAASLVYGLLSGGFVARAITIHRFARSRADV